MTILDQIVRDKWSVGMLHMLATPAFTAGMVMLFVMASVHALRPAPNRA